MLDAITPLGFILIIFVSIMQYQCYESQIKDYDAEFCVAMVKVFKNLKNLLQNFEDLVRYFEGKVCSVLPVVKFEDICNIDLYYLLYVRALFTRDHVLVVRTQNQLYYDDPSILKTTCYLQEQERERVFVDSIEFVYKFLNLCMNHQGIDFGDLRIHNYFYVNSK
eukprot:TRINITY_DN27465_c1_g1_i1.p1 TRINITY_DN27465_c1_g1~~TRINITY_DN27465_c1_g1_i1.p1  ORF type:complete len:165 (-),score=12.72 TRINITY_DN27465_c1_g1_i1:253-747(-)